MLKEKNVEEFYDLFDVVNNILLVFGLSFFGRYKGESGSKYGLSIKRLAYGIFCCIFVLFVFHQQLTVFYPKEMDDNIVVILLYLYMAVVGTLMAILMMVTAATAASPLSRLLNNSEYFELFTIREMYQGLRCNTVQQIVFSLSVLSACYISDFVADQNYSFGNAIKIFFFFFFPMYNSFCISQFFNIHYWIQGLYRNINCSLENLVNERWSERQLVDLQVATKKGRRKQNLKGLRTAVRNNYYIGDNGVHSEILRLRRLYHKTHTVRNIINEVYSTRNVLLLLHHCALEIVYTYWGFRHLLDEKSQLPLTAKLNNFKAAFMSSVSVVTMLWPCITTKVEANRTIYLVQELFAEAVGGPIRYEIFVLQLLQEKYEFAPHGFFEMNNKLFLSLVAAVSSYMVILLQYHMVTTALQETKNSFMANNSVSALM